MKIDSVDIQSYVVGTFESTHEGLYHVKTLPTLSIAQVIQGSYEFGFDREKLHTFTKLESFIAPGDKQQFIIHHLNAETQHFSSQYLFIDLIINKNYKLEDVFELPMSIPSKYNFEVFEIIRYVLSNKQNICAVNSKLYRIAEILLEISEPKETGDSIITEFKTFIAKNYSKKITSKSISEQFAISIPTVFRKFQTGFGMTPANYINSVRLSQAAIMLETTSKSTGSIGYEVGFEDVFYFSKLFKNKYGLAPSLYRDKIINNK